MADWTELQNVKKIHCSQYMYLVFSPPYTRAFISNNLRFSLGRCRPVALS